MGGASAQAEGMKPTLAKAESSEMCAFDVASAGVTAPAASDYTGAFVARAPDDAADGRSPHPRPRCRLRASVTTRTPRS